MVQTGKCANEREDMNKLDEEQMMQEEERLVATYARHCQRRLKLKHIMTQPLE